MNRDKKATLIPFVLLSAIVAILSNSAPTKADGKEKLLVRSVVYGDKNHPVPDVGVVLVYAPIFESEPWTIVDRTRANNLGEFQFESPSGLDLVLGELRIVLLATGDTGAVIYSFQEKPDRDGRGAPKPTGYFAPKRNRLFLTVRDLSGAPVVGAEVIRIGREGGGIDFRGFRSIPELAIRKSDAEGKIEVDFCSIADREFSIFTPKKVEVEIAHPKYMKSQVFCKNLDPATGECDVDVTLEEGEVVGLRLDDLRIENRDDPIRVVVDGTVITLDTKKVAEVMIPPNSKANGYWLSYGDGKNHYEIARSFSNLKTRELTITVCSRQAVRGIVKNRTTGEAVANRVVVATSKYPHEFYLSARTGKDGSFRILIPKLDGEVTIGVREDSTIELQVMSKFHWTVVPNQIVLELDK